MAWKNRKKAKSLRALPIDLRELAGEPMESIAARVREATSAGLSVFDVGSAQRYVSSGRLVAPMGTHVDVSGSGVRIRHGVSSRALSVRDLSVTPGLDRPTTGADRQRVTVEGRRGNAIEVPDGFIWAGSIFMRTDRGRSFKSAKSWLVKSGADPSPARMLGDAANDVMSAEIDILLRGLDDAGTDNK